MVLGISVVNNLRGFMRYFYLIILFLSSSSYASDAVDLDFRSVPIVEFSNAVFSGILHSNYILASSLLNSDAKITVSLKSVNKANLIPIVKNALQNEGINLTQINGIYYLNRSIDKVSPNSLPLINPDKVQELPKDYIYHIYYPKYRQVSSLSKIAKFSGVDVLDDAFNDKLLLQSTDRAKLDNAVTLLSQFDTQIENLTIKAALVEYTTTKDKSFSISGLLTLLSKKLSITYAAGALLPNSIVFKGATIQAALSSLQGDSNYRYLAQPILRVQDGKRSRIQVGQDVPVRGQITQDKNGTSFQSVDYKTSGIQLSILPRISGENVTLELEQEISNFGITTSSNIDSPTLFKRKIESTLDLKKGSLAVLAGLDETKESNSNSGVSFVPFLRSSSSFSTTSNILLLLEVVDDSQKI